MPTQLASDLAKDSVLSRLPPPELTQRGKKDHQLRIGRVVTSSGSGHATTVGRREGGMGGNKKAGSKSDSLPPSLSPKSRDEVFRQKQSEHLGVPFESCLWNTRSMVYKGHAIRDKI